MKRMISYLLLTLCALAVPMGLQARRAMLVAHYGSSDDSTRAVTIDKITADIRSAMPDIEVRQAYISPVVRRNLAKRGIDSDSPVQAMLRLCTEGYDTVYVQSTTIIDGAEMAEVRAAVEQTRPFFKHVVTGRPLCYSPQDCMEVVSVLMSEPHEEDEAVIFVGHGNNLPSTATYCQLDYMMSVSGTAGYHVSTIEGYPTAQTTLAELAADRTVKRLKLVPLLLVCGNHTKNDIAKDFADAMKAGGYSATVVMHGLGENRAIRALYVTRALQLLSQ